MGVEDQVTGQLADQLQNMQGLFSISIPGLIAGLIFSTVGLWLWRQPKAKEDIRLRLTAAVLIVYTYITPGPISDWTFGILLCGFAYFLWHE